MPLPAILGAVAVGAYAVQKIADVVGTTVATVRKNVPILDDQVVVEVQGQPGSNKQELYFLALAAANGVVRRFQPLILINPAIPPTMALLAIEYDAADSWVRCTLHYRTGTLANNVIMTSGKTNKDYIDQLAVYRGPQCEVVGSPLDFVDKSVLPGIPQQGEAPFLPWAGRTIVNNCPTVQNPIVALVQNNPPPTDPVIPTNEIISPNPKPPGDNRSRGAVPVSVGTGGGGSQFPGNGACCPRQLNLVQLVFSALTDPSSDAEIAWIAPTTGPTGK